MPQQGEVENCLTGDGELSRLMRAHDWSATSLGPVEAWPQSLKIVVRILLDSRYAMWLGWGPDFTFFYNDAYARMSLGAKHPWALGRPAREVWAEIWDDIGPRAESVVRTGKATWDERLLLFLERRGFPEETYHTFSYSPVPGDSGGVGGMLCVVTEDTERTIGERRLKTLRELAARTTEEARSAEDACQSAARILAGNPHDLPFVLLYLTDADARTARLAGATGLKPGTPAAPSDVDLTAPQAPNAGWPLRAVLETGRAEVVADIGLWLGSQPVGVYPEPPHTAAVLPVRKSGQERLAGFLVAGVSPRRPFDDDYRGFLDLLAGQIATAVTNARAYEEEKKRAEALAELDRAKTAFFSNVSHEFRTPLTLMLGPVEDALAETTGDSTPAHRERMEVVHRNGLRLKKLVNTLLDFSRIEAGRVQASYEPTDLASFTAELASSFRSACERAGLELAVDCPPTTEPVYVDREMWEKIVLNLLSNAFKYTLAGRIAVSLRQDGRTAELAVQDTGTGIPPDQMPHLFERFHRVEGARGRTQEGSGIGLALVRELARLHGGDVQAESRLGEGTTFRLTVPLGTAHLPQDRIKASRSLGSTALGATAYVEEALRWLPDSAQGRPDSFRSDEGDVADAARPPANGERARILLADDNADMRDYIRRLLAGHYEVTAVADGVAAREAAGQRPPDLVLSDVMMPGLDGFGLLRELRADPRTQGLPVILLSARAGEEARVEGLQSGADDYLTKPFSAKELLARIASALAIARLRREGLDQERRLLAAVEEQRNWLRVTLASIGDAVIATDTAGRAKFLNPVAEALTGWREEEARGRALDEIFTITNETTGQPVENPVATVLQEGRIVGLANHTTLSARDGTKRPIDDSAAPIKAADGTTLGVVLTFRDVTEQRRVGQQRNVRLAVTHALSEAESVADGAAGVLRAVCENLGWDVGLFWTVNEAGTALVCTKSWHRQDGAAKEFETASCSRTFTKGEGLPGRVWASGQPAWVLDIAHDGNFPRLAPAVRYGLHSAFACPVVVGDRALGVIEFFTQHIYEPDTNLLEMMGTVAGSIGHFIERKTAEDELRQSEEELADFFENATVGLHWVGPDGIILRANRAELDMLGYRREEYVGRPIAEFHADEEVICDILKRLSAGEKLEEYPARLKCKDGSIRDVLINSSVMWRDGQFVHTRCFTRDVTERKRAEAKIREQEQRTRTILESISDAFCALDREWRFTYVNQQAEALLGRRRAELIGENHWDVYPDTLGTDLERHYRRVVAEGVTARFENYYPPHDRWYEVHAYPSPDGLSVYFRDVSERKRAEVALRESEQRFRQLADAMPQIVWTARSDGNIDYLNRRWTEFTGLPQTVSNEGWAPLLHPDEAPEAYERWAASVRSGAPFEMELRLLDRREQNYRWHLIRTVAVPDGDGKVARWFGTSTDIHEQKRAEQSSRFLAQASAELAGVVDYESTLQKVVNLAVPYFADWSAADLAGEEGNLQRLAVAHQDPDKIALVRELMKVYPPDPQSSVGVYAVLRTGKPALVGEITDEILVRGAKDERHLRLIRSLGLKSYMCVPLVVSGKTLGLLTFATAESGRKYAEADLALAVDLAHRAAVAIENTQLYQALREADRRKDEFLATLAHELRNPLAPVRNALQILKMPRVDAQTVERSREMMERQVQHLVRLVDDLMDVSRVMRGKITLHRERVELATVIARAVEIVQPLVEAQHHELSVGVSSESLLLDADPVRLAQVVGNLLTNAAKYTEPGGRIWVTAERDGDMATLRVRDNGIGIAPHMLPRIFDLFVQVDHAATKSQGGLGIGLTLVKNLAEMHNGIVQAHSRGLGTGSEFVVKLPLAAPALRHDHAAEEGRQGDRQPPPSGRRLLVVDDNQDAAESLAMLLRLHGHEVRVAYSGVAALEMTKTYSPDAVFLDIGMPGMDGYEVARRLRQIPGRGDLMLAALTGWGQQEDRRRTAEAGFDHHLVKPPEPEAIEELLAELKRPAAR